LNSYNERLGLKWEQRLPREGRRMPVLRVQKLFVPDCAPAIEREYFGWGRGRAGDSPDPEWEKASTERRRVVTLRGYDCYDGYPFQPGDSIGLAEIYASVGLNSRVILNDAVRFLVRADEARPLLARIPDGIALEEATDDQLAAAAAVIDLLAGAHQIGRGKATKVLHKKRPHFMPILDSVVFDFLWKNFPHIMRQGSPTLDYIKLYRDVLLARRPVLAETYAELSMKSLTLSMTRILDFLIWLGWRDKVDEFGFGPRITEVWETTSIREAREKARQSWQRHNER
jgi:hypothetical protein